ncbi:hypothetical protein VTL71DRAFT_7368 [Oculimacula yallundae]|uniref:Uncharacterized protein n=1 Tax=Oculimacula yallundae TaxID=86028 RepID=A0ABR4BWH2_9HELO
MLDSEPKSLSF